MGTDLDGATTRPEPGVMFNTGGEFAAAWNSRTEEERDLWVRGTQEMQQRSIRCFQMNHDARIEQLEQLLRDTPGEVRKIAAQKLRDYWDACGDMIDSHNTARLAFDAIAAQLEDAS